MPHMGLRKDSSDPEHPPSSLFLWAAEPPVGFWFRVQSFGFGVWGSGIELRGGVRQCRTGGYEGMFRRILTKNR